MAARVAPFDGGYRAWRAAVGGRLANRRGVRARGGALPRPAGGRRGRRGARSRAHGGGGALRHGRWSRPPKPPRRPAPAARQPKLSKDSYRRQKALIDDDLTRLGLRKNHLELALLDPSIAANFVELRRVTSELADVDQALGGGRRGLAAARGAGAVRATGGTVSGEAASPRRGRSGSG